MASREENLKKINEELEKLDDEQLEQVAGGVHKYWKTNSTVEEIQENNNEVDAAFIALKTYLNHIF